MSLAPIFSSPCDLAQRAPGMVAGFLELESRVSRRFREDSVTDVIVASLLQVGDKNVSVVVPYEPKSGSDFDIVLVDAASRDAVQFRIQAKRLHPHPMKWEMGSYRELAHPTNSGKQAASLVRSSAHEKIPTIPLYAFYHPESTCIASGGAISGIEMASGVAVRSYVHSIVSAKPRRPPLKRVAALRHLFFPFSTLLCGSSTRRFLPPEEARIAVQGAIDARQEIVLPSLELYHEETLAIESAMRAARERPRNVGRAKGLTAIVEAAVERPGATLRAQIHRPKLILLSRSD